MWPRLDRRGELLGLFVNAFPALAGSLVLLAMVGLRTPGQDIGEVATEEAVVEFDEAPSGGRFDKEIVSAMVEKKLIPAVEVVIESLPARNERQPLFLFA